MKSSVPRRKAWKPKTKTGCLTCRVRRIKCDEHKPHCKKCMSTGRNCDGYETTSSNAVARRSSSTSSSSTASPSTLLPYDPGEYVGTAEERQSFHFFLAHSATEFTGFFDSSRFLIGTLQAAQFKPEIRHALTAIGAMHKKYLSGAVPVVADDPTDAGIRFALQQCNLSINHLVEKQKKDNKDKETVLILCQLYFSFACMQGDQIQGLGHLRAALSILNDINAAKPSASNKVPIDMSTLRTAYVGLDSMARAILPDIIVRKWIECPAAIRDPGEPPDTFTSLGQASDYIEEAFNSLFSAMQNMAKQATSTPESVALANAQHTRYTRYFNAAHAALDTLASSLLTSAGGLTPAQKKTISMLRLYRSIAAAVLAILRQSPVHGEKAWDLVTPSFTSVVTCAARILGASDSLDELAGTISRTPDIMDKYPDSSDIFHAEARRVMAISARPPEFSCRFGIVFPLYLVAARCREPLLRRKALALLLHYPRREGLWDGIMAGRIAFEVMCLEEDGAGVKVEKASDVPEEVRMRGVAITYPGPRRADVHIRNVRQWTRGEEGLRRVLTW